MPLWSVCFLWSGKCVSHEIHSQCRLLHLDLHHGSHWYKKHSTAWLDYTEVYSIQLLYNRQRITYSQSMSLLTYSGSVCFKSWSGYWIHLSVDFHDFLQNWNNNWSSACFMLVSCLAYFLTLKMEVIYSSETSIDFHWTTQLFSKDIELSIFNHYEKLKCNLCFMIHLLIICIFFEVIHNKTYSFDLKYVISENYRNMWIKFERSLKLNPWKY
jgi:hypothetical protein